MSSQAAAKKTVTIFRIEWHDIQLSCKYFYWKTNPFRLYAHSMSFDNGNTWPTKHTKQIAAYGDLTSIMFYVYHFTLYVEHGYHTGQGEKLAYDSILKA